MEINGLSLVGMYYRQFGLGGLLGKGKIAKQISSDILLVEEFRSDGTTSFRLVALSDLMHRCVSLYNSREDLMKSKSIAELMTKDAAGDHKNRGNQCQSSWWQRLERRVMGK